MRFLLRDEARATERRAPIAPHHAAKLTKGGLQLDVEESKKRIFSDSEYKKAGCRLIPAGSWIDANPETVILGLKELPEHPENLTSPMVHFAHIYKEQSGWQKELMRFSRGGGTLYDIEYLTTGSGGRVAAFSFWAGWMGAALAIWRYLARQAGEAGPAKDLSSFSNRSEIVGHIEALASKVKVRPRAIVIGAKGRSGGGAVAALKIANAEITEWDMAETANLDRSKLLSHDILVSCVLLHGPGLLLATLDDLSSSDTRLSMISDVACDPFSSFNPLPVYQAPTSWETPFIEIGTNQAGESIELTSIDNLPSLIPKESSENFSTEFSACLARFDHGEEWQAAKAVFRRKLAEAQSSGR